MAKLFVIAGHGGGDPGACANGYSEAERVRVLASKLKEMGGDAVIVGRTDIDWFGAGAISTESIPAGVELLELHMDSGSASAKGAHVIIKEGYSPDAYDRALAANVCALLPGRSRTIVGRRDLANPNRAAARGLSYRLLECGFISNSGDVSVFNNRMDELAAAILKSYGIPVLSREGWVHSAAGWWWRNTDGSYPRSEWRGIDGDWYYFGADGYAYAGRWIQDGGHWYYLGADCRMAKGWIKQDGVWYYLREKNYPRGSMATKWEKVGEHWYYFSPVSTGRHMKGSMRVGWVEDNGEWYFMNHSDSGLPYGAMLSERWVADCGRKYYLKKDGKMASGEKLTIGGKEYIFDDSGVCK